METDREDGNQMIYFVDSCWRPTNRTLRLNTQSHPFLNLLEGIGWNMEARQIFVMASIPI